MATHAITDLSHLILGLGDYKCDIYSMSKCVITYTCIYIIVDDQHQACVEIN